ncbi:hypothetical protein Plec18167_005391 [Paecilomyces lecythidis]|uniref:Arginine metabolism regulation protein II n=1 Tax=Paecilomyces lecythidis TaxID=3004212 RepID=A0ABR3XJM5_9EURO
MAVPPCLTLQWLVEIDEEAERVSMSQDLQVRRGPFGAFRLDRNHCSAPSSLSLDNTRSNPATSGPYMTTSDGSFACGPGAVDLDNNELLSSHSNEILSLDAAMLDSIVGVSGISPPDSFELLDLPSSGIMETQHSPNATIDLSETTWPVELPASQNAQHTPGLPHRETISYQLRTALDSSVSAVPPNISVILQHYSTHVINFLSPFHHSKTPWHIMFIPQAKRCVAALTLGETLDHASLCTFYAILAVSAFSLGGISRASMWIHEGQRYEQSARQQCRFMLETAYNIPKTAKYKSILMALISMIQVSIYLNDWSDADYFFLEAEKFIRLRGLKRTKSRKVRLLHHCYAFWRIFHESAYIGDRPTSHRRRVLQAIQSSEFAIYSHDSLSFRLPTWTDLQKEMKEIKTKDVGENDLHIERPGTWPATLYPEIFGVPEPWLFLLSLIIRLGKEKDAATQHEVPDSLSLSEFLSRASTIESFILHLHRQREAEHRSAEHWPADLLTLHCLIDAVLYAIEIFFYRRVYDLHGGLLQHRVRAVHDCLVHCWPGEGTGHGMAGFAWPAFIAACEAEDPAVQATFVSWFQMFAKQSGLQVLHHVIQVVRQIWKEKAHSTKATLTWIELMKRAQQRATETVP